MKKLLLAATVLVFSLLASPSQAQISLSVNIGIQPSWGPVGYEHVEYYYIPDIECYYYVPDHQFVYMNRGHWTFSRELPSRYRNFDLYHCHKEVVNEPQAYLHFEEHRARFANFKGDPHGQVFIRDSHEERYRDHWHDQHEANEEWRHRH
ncbi:MAG TPA: hypothetical protein VI233_15720 [Puia sp.]